MTVKELIEQLKDCPENYEVNAWMSDGKIEVVMGISIVCDETKSIAISGIVNNCETIFASFNVDEIKD
jgi:hypothetical protein